MRLYFRGGTRFAGGALEIQQNHNRFVQCEGAARIVRAQRGARLCFNHRTALNYTEPRIFIFSLPLGQKKSLFERSEIQKLSVGHRKFRRTLKNSGSE